MQSPEHLDIQGNTSQGICIDYDVLEWFRSQVHASGGGNYQTLINKVLRDYVYSDPEPMEDKLRLVVREELARYKRSRK